MPTPAEDVANGGGITPGQGAVIGGGIQAAGALASAGLGLWNARWQQKHADNMANTAYQRAVADMRKAGLNPLMMFGGGSGGRPADSPLQQGGVSGTNLLDGLGESINSASRLNFEKRRLELEADMTAAQVVKAQADAEAAKANAARAVAEAGRTTKETDPAVAKLLAEVELLKRNTHLSVVTAKGAEAQLPEKQARGKVAGTISEILDEVLNRGDPRTTGQIWKEDVVDPVKAWFTRTKKSVSDWFGSGQGNVDGGASSAQDFHRRTQFDKRGW